MSDILLTGRYWKVLCFKPTLQNLTKYQIYFLKGLVKSRIILCMLLPRDRPLLSATCLLLILKVSLIKTLIVLKSITTQVSFCVRYCLTLAVVFCENVKIEHMNCSCRREGWIKKNVKKVPHWIDDFTTCEKSIGVLFQCLLLLLLLPLFFLFSLVRQFKCRCHPQCTPILFSCSLFLIRKKKKRGQFRALPTLSSLSFSLYLLYPIPNLCCPT